VSNVQIPPTQYATPVSQAMPYSLPPSQPVNVQQPIYGQGQTNAVPSYPSNPSVPAAQPMPQMPLDPATQQQLLLLKTLMDQGVPQDQIGTILAALSGANGAANGYAPQTGGPVQTQNPTQNAWGARPDDSRDHNGMRSPQGQYRRRSRSQSPSRGWAAHDSPGSRRREDPYGRDIARGDEYDRGRAANYRQRSPQGRRRSPTPPRNDPASKWTDHDPTIGKNSIKGTQKIGAYSGIIANVSQS
jgi:protein NRD1